MSARDNQPTGWVGWVYFASFMMMLLGVFQAIAGLVAIFKDDFYVATSNSLLVFDYSTWGWVNLLIGLVIVLAGMALLNGSTWARILAIFLAGLSFLANMGFANAYPVWSVVMMVVDVLVIYAVTVHGGEVRE